jgi:Ca2+-binding RTX toxin-like protein
VLVTINGVPTTVTQPFQRILVYGQAGNDGISLLSLKTKGATYFIDKPAYVYGGGDYDTINAGGSTAHNVLFGDGGADVLSGGTGRDLLIGGAGADRLTGSRRNSILIGGFTAYDVSSPGLTYDRKLASLDAIMAEWGSAGDFTTRMNHLLGPDAGGRAGGLNGSSFLNPATVHDDGSADTLDRGASSESDWFFAGLLDVLKKRRGDTVTSIL